MKNSLKISLKPNEKIYINGAVVRVDRKVSIEFLNDVQFLLENHVLQPEQASTPLRQLYFIVQVILMNPTESEEARALFRRTLPLLLSTFSDAQVRATLKDVDRLVSEGEDYEGVGEMRGPCWLEADNIGGARAAQAPQNIAQAGAA